MHTKKVLTLSGDLKVLLIIVGLAFLAGCCAGGVVF